MKSRGLGCLETAALAVFALLLGAFTASTVLRHVDLAPTPPPTTTDEDSLGPRTPPLERSTIRVEVRNGSGRAGAAGHLTELLRREGFDVVDFGNAERFDHARTIVIDRGGQPSEAREVAAALHGAPVVSQPDSTLLLDVTVIVGRDFQRLAPPPTRRPADAPPVWRRWLERIEGIWR